MKAIVFDFNGTMFIDTDKQQRAWELCIREWTGHELTDEEFRAYVCGPANLDILRRFCRAGLTAAEAEALAEQKEGVYRRLCRQDGENLRLAAGLPELLDRLAAARVPMTIATGAGRGNLEFYFEVFDLQKWFAWDKVVYDDGTLPGKPNPRIYLRACEVLGLPPADCLVVEDSFAGIRAAFDAGAGGIVAIAASNPRAALEGLRGVRAVIDDYHNFPFFTDLTRVS